MTEADLLSEKEIISLIKKQDSKYIIPSQYILPQEDYNGIILNLAELRLYYYMPSSDLYENRKVLTYPVGIGRLDWKTPLGETFIKSKVANPSWFPPKSIILEHEERGEIDKKEYYIKEFYSKLADNESNKRIVSSAFPISPFAVR